jgi:hypothetical protein
VLTIVLVASAVMLAVGVGPRSTGTARALLPAQQPAGATIPYPGHLTDEAGQPVADGAYDFTFALYAAESGGAPVWTEAQEGVVVQGGAFAVQLGSATPLPQEALDGGARWLEVGVRGPGEAEFTLLSPRQEMSVASSMSPASPSAGPSCPHDHLYENWIGSSAGYTFRVENTSTGDGIRGISYATASDYAGVVGAAYAAGGSGVYWLSTSSGRGVYGVSTSGDGVVGETGVAVKSGVYGNNTGSGFGVYGRSATGFGMGVAGNDASQWDTLGDLRLDGQYGEIFVDGTSSADFNLLSNDTIIFDLDNNQATGPDNSYLRVYNGADTSILNLDESGNLWVLGQLQATGGKPSIVDTEHYGTRKLYAMESPELWFEDFGTASLVDGEATVAFEPIFAETVNLEEDYHVFVTPLCQEPVLLFVTAKTSTGFTVQGVTLDNQPSDCVFDYRVVAKRLGYEDVRLDETSRPEEAGK